MAIAEVPQKSGTGYLVTFSTAKERTHRYFGIKLYGTSEAALVAALDFEKAEAVRLGVPIRRKAQKNFTAPELAGTDPQPRPRIPPEEKAPQMGGLHAAIGIVRAGKPSCVPHKDCEFTEGFTRGLKTCGTRLELIAHHLDEDEGPMPRKAVAKMLRDVAAWLEGKDQQPGKEKKVA